MYLAINIFMCKMNSPVQSYHKTGEETWYWIWSLLYFIRLSIGTIKQKMYI